MKRRAFTLIELLVVIALIAVLAALLMPVHQGSRENPHKSSCQSNLKKIALGVMQYMNDYDERYSLVFVTDAPGPTPPYGWADALQPYIKNSEVYQCPSDTNEGSQSPAQNGYTDYWYNANLVTRINRNGATVFFGCNESALHAKSQTILIGDGGNEDDSDGHNAAYNQCGDGKSLSGRNQICAQSESMTATYPAAQIHLDGANFAFADGHVKWLRGNNPTQSAAVLSNRADYSNIGHKYAFWLNNNWLKKKP
jgi:prepilin-type N-terminal cleavage/methylation domain-containing protein/prepilin-type processing-associated H-X9-DG protein